ncbi:MAG: response regulator transcription factor [Bacillota bacterium]
MRILIVDDDRLVSGALKTILEADKEIEVAGMGNSGREAVELHRRLKPDVLLMDIRMDGMTGLEAAEAILKEDNSARILFLTTFSDDEYIAKAFQIGAKGYILKQDYESIIPSVKAVFMGQRVFGDEIISKFSTLKSNTGNTYNTGNARNTGSIAKTGEKAGTGLSSFNLSEKEIEIIKLVADGLSNKEISETLYLSEGTVRNYISVILEKLDLRDRTQLAIFYYKHT